MLYNPNRTPTRAEMEQTAQELRDKIAQTPQGSRWHWRLTRALGRLERVLKTMPDRDIFDAL